MEEITKRDVKKLLPHRDPNSYKGQNGRVLIVGGSIDYYGAAILAGIAALGGGADLVHLLVPECNFEVSRNFYPDFIVHKYPGLFLNSRALDEAVSIGEKCDAILLGPGIGNQEESARVVAQIVQRTQRPTVLDADGLTALKHLQQGENITITPHRGEFQSLTGNLVSHDIEVSAKAVLSYANENNLTILLKGEVDIVASPNKDVRVNTTGHPGLTVGGTGDTLAGLVASLIAGKLSPIDACSIAAFTVGACGENLAKHKGNGYTASDIALEIPYVLGQLQ